MKDLLIDKDRSKEINKFLKCKRESKQLYSLGFNFRWEWIVREWFKRLQELEVDPRNLFIKKEVCGKPLDCCNLPDLTWGKIKKQGKYSLWPDGSIEEIHVDLQEDLDREPYRGINSYRPWDLCNFPEYRSYNKGELHTLDCLWNARDNLDSIFAILVQASHKNDLTETIDTSTYNLDSLDLLYVVWDVAIKFQINCNWHHWSPRAIPEPNIWSEEEGGYSLRGKKRVRSFRMLVRAFADHHAYILKYYRPVYYERVDYRIPEIDKLIAKRNVERERAKQAENARLEKLWAENEKRRQEAKKVRQRQILDQEKWLEEKRANHPRYEDWDSLTKVELQKLVWSKPTTQIAKDFGYSDVSIKKKCKKFGIKKPPPGFWRKVEAGKIPHPAGVPV